MVFSTIFFTTKHPGSIQHTLVTNVPFPLCHSFIHSFFHVISSVLLREKPKNSLRTALEQRYKPHRKPPYKTLFISILYFFYSET